MAIADIKKIAQKPRDNFIQISAKASERAEKIFQKHKRKIDQWVGQRKNTFHTSTLKTQKDDPPCVKRLVETGAKTGQRNNYTFEYAVYCLNKGMSQQETLQKCIQFADKSTDPLSDSEVERIVESAAAGVQDKRYSVGCSSEPFSSLCDKANCPFFNTCNAENTQSWEDIGEPISFVDWKININGNFPNLWPYAEACASTIATLLIENTQPLALVLQGVPSGGKTTTLDFFRGFPFSHATDKFSPRAFVSHMAQRSEDQLKKIDLLPRIQGRVLITPDLTTLFGAKAEELKETFSILTRVLDGRGLIIDSGVYGSRGYEGDYMFTWIGATTPIPHAVWDLFGNLGARMYFMPITTTDIPNVRYIANLKQTNYRLKVQKCNDATLRFLKGIWKTEKTSWDSTKDPDQTIDSIVNLAKVVCRLRGKINVVVKDDYAHAGEKIHYTEPVIEEPDRCIQALYSLARGHALLCGKTQIGNRDLPVVIDVALGSAPWERINLFTYLLTKAPNPIKTSDVMNDLKCSRPKALRAMKTLELLGLVELEETPVITYGGEQTGYTIQLKEEFAWFYSEEFRLLWRQRKQPATSKTEKEAEAEDANKFTLDSFGLEIADTETIDESQLNELNALQKALVEVITKEGKRRCNTKGEV